MVSVFNFFAFKPGTIVTPGQPAYNKEEHKIESELLGEMKPTEDDKKEESAQWWRLDSVMEREEGEDDFWNFDLFYNKRFC